MVVTDGIQFTELVELGYLAPLDHSKLPNFAKYAGPTYKDESFDPGQRLQRAVGIRDDRHRLQHQVRQDAADQHPRAVGPEVQGQGRDDVGPRGTRELRHVRHRHGPGDVHAGRLGEGRRPSSRRSATPAWSASTTSRTTSRHSARATSGSPWRWSGDIFQQNLSEHTELKFVIPKEGATIWTDNMMLPKTAAEPGRRDHLDGLLLPAVGRRQPDRVHQLRDAGAGRADSPSWPTRPRRPTSDKASFQQVANSPLVFPSEADYAKLKHYRAFKNEQEKQQYLSIFEPITQS